jgi:Uma2 family endonuclease
LPNIRIFPRPGREANPVGILYGAPFDVYLTETDVFQPDLLVVLNENRSVLTEAGAEGAPDFVIEILSPKTRQLDLVNKKRVYARLGVKELWIIDPDPGTVSIYRFEENASEPVQIVRPGESLAASILPGFALTVDAALRRP